MKYVIAKKTDLEIAGLQPSSRKIINGYMLINENELRYHFPTIKTLEEAADQISGIIVTKSEGYEFINGGGNSAIQSIDK